MMNSKTIARSWAKEHPAETALLFILTDGRNGYAENTHEWYAHEGQVAKKQFSVIGAGNGVCGVCGLMFLDPVIRVGWLPDPEGGEPLADNDYQYPAYMRDKIVRAAYAFVCACPGCVSTHHLTLDRRGSLGQVDGWIDDRFHVSRVHPTLFRHGEPPIVRIDERPITIGRQRGAALRPQEAAV